MKITIIGAGNLGKAIANGLLESNKVKPKDLTLTKRNFKTLEKFKKQGVQVTSDNKLAVKEKDIILLCVQPHKLDDVLNEITSELKNGIIISTITGITLNQLQSKINNNIGLFRAMPNTAIAIKESMTCIATNNGTEKQRKIVEKLFNALGESLFIEEELMGSATVLAASGTALLYAT